MPSRSRLPPTVTPCSNSWVAKNKRFELLSDISAHKQFTSFTVSPSIEIIPVGVKLAAISIAEARTLTILKTATIQQEHKNACTTEKNKRQHNNINFVILS